MSSEFPYLEPVINTEDAQDKLLSNVSKWPKK